MVALKALYKAMYDDLKDSDMMIDYAYELKGTDYKTVSKEFYQYAQERMNHFKKFHELFVSEVKSSKKNPNETKELVEDCLWSVTHEHLQEWADKIRSKIDSY